MLREDCTRECGGLIRILPNMEPSETLATFVHELAHEMLHRAERRIGHRAHRLKRAFDLPPDGARCLRRSGQACDERGGFRLQFND